ncbi:MAG: hypothetical protein US76_02715 [Parcubacteria group bacterium GW2011_GWA2_38_13b]|nr:MAG: hypothetical protein US76_02715 [Parcubacteria group bacterium GW2011_GWA2_38_13b]
MPIELIQKKDIRQNDAAFKIKSWSGFFIGVFFLSLLGYGGLFGYKNYLSGNLGNLDIKIDEISQGRDMALEQEVEVLDNQIFQLSVILKKHFYWSNLFSDLEKLALAQAYFKTFNGGINANGEGIVNIDIQTTDYLKAAAQIKILEQYPYFKNVDVSSIGLEDDSVNFSANITFDPILLSGAKKK